MGAVTTPLCTPLHHLFTYRLTVKGPANASKHINECCCPVEAVFAQFRGLVIVGENVMVVVPPLAECSQAHEYVFYGADCPNIK